MPQVTEPKRPRYTDTTNATLARRMKKWRRWAEEMRANGWTVAEPGGQTTPGQ